MISYQTSGSFKNTQDFLKKLASGDLFSNLDKYGKMGVYALAKHTPRDTGLTANSWGYKVIKSKTKPGIEWYNTNVKTGVSVAILIQYGHGTKNGGYVSGVDYINPAIRPIFDEIVADIWRQVTL
jgi:hypothetical protein